MALPSLLQKELYCLFMKNGCIAYKTNVWGYQNMWVQNRKLLKKKQRCWQSKEELSKRHISESKDTN